MVSDGTKTFVERAWKCLETGNMLGQMGDGCVGSGEPSMFSGWSIQVADAGYRNEIMRYTVDACYLEIARNSNMAEEHGMTLEEIVDLMKTLQAENVTKVVSSIEPLIKNIESRQERMAIYVIFKKLCIDAALSEM